MKRFISYLLYIVRHKWLVFLVGRQKKLPLLQLLFHDLSKFRPDEWGPYSWTFYSDHGTPRYYPTDEFAAAWLRHQHRNPHHWQYWVLKEDDGSLRSLKMPQRYVLEMVADWAGASMTITEQNNLSLWWMENRSKVMLHSETLAEVDALVADWGKDV